MIIAEKCSSPIVRTTINLGSLMSVIMGIVTQTTIAPLSVVKNKWPPTNKVIVALRAIAWAIYRRILAAAFQTAFRQKMVICAMATVAPQMMTAHRNAAIQYQVIMVLHARMTIIHA